MRPTVKRGMTRVSTLSTLTQLPVDIKVRVINSFSLRIPF